jgi:hypothetical protein
MTWFYKRGGYANLEVGRSDRRCLSGLQLSERARDDMKLFREVLIGIITGLVASWLYDRYWSQIKQRYIEVEK